MYSSEVHALLKLYTRALAEWMITVSARAVQVTVNLKALSVGDVVGEDCVLGFETRQYQVTRCQLAF